MTEQTGQKEKARIIWIDLIRVIAIMMVVLCHATEGVYGMGIEQILRLPTVEKVLVFTCFTVGRLGVPLFLLISGYLLLDRKYDRQAMTRFWKKSWLHLAVCSLVWFLVYDLFLIFVNGKSMSVIDVILDLLFIGKVNISHVWYLLMIIGLYPLIPFVANALQAVEDRKQAMIPMGFFFLFLFLYPFASLLLQVASPDYPGFSSQLGEGFSGGTYGFYLLCGWLVKKQAFRKVKLLWLTLIVAISVALAVWIQLYRYACGYQYKIYYNSVLLLIPGVCLFELISRWRKTGEGKALAWLSGFAFGVYLTHNPIRLYMLGVAGKWACAKELKTLIVMMISLTLGFAAAWLISLIPKAGNYLIYRKKPQAKRTTN